MTARRNELRQDADAPSPRIVRGPCSLRRHSPPDRHPAAVYLSSLADGPGRASMRATLAHVATMLGAPGIEACPWQALMYSYGSDACAGVKHASPHDLRRTFVSSALAAGADLARVQRLAGHRNPATTERYDRRPDDALREAAALVPVPYYGAAH